jgi:hypothetical protein
VSYQQQFFDLRTTVAKALLIRQCDPATYRRCGNDYRGALIKLEELQRKLAEYQQLYNKDKLRPTDIRPMSKLEDKAKALAATISTEQRELSHAQ